MSSFLEREHPDITYLKQDGIGLILSKGLSETFKAQPRNQVQYFAKFLLNYSMTQKKSAAVMITVLNICGLQEQERLKVVKDLKDKHVYFIKQKQKEQEELLKEEREKQQKVQKFYEMLEKSEDLNDNLDELANFIQEFTGASGVYIGKLEKPRRDIGDDDDDKAHFDRENPKVIRFITASNDHEFMRGKILKVNQGITHDVYKQVENEGAPVEENEEGQVIEKPVSDDILVNFKHIYVKEVVREPRMHFYKVPRLGAFMAIPLEYQSCLSENALDNAVQDYLAVQKAREDQEKAKLEWEDEVNRIRDEKEKLGETWEPEPKEWEYIQERQFDSKKKSFVVCLDTMGQDRELTDFEKRFALDTVLNFRSIWERTEIENLTKDRNRKLEFMEIDREFLDQHAQKLFEEEEQYLEEALKQSEEPLDEEQKDVYLKQARLTFIARLFRDKEEWKRNLMNLRNFKVMKMPRVLQSIFYLLRYKREQICQKGTNKFFWKIAKNQINDEFIERMLQYRAFGPKDDYYERYTTINFIERNIEGIIPEDVDHYNLTLGKLFKWLIVAVKTRKDDITLRKVKKKKAREDREMKIQKEADRKLRMEQDVIDAENKFKEDHREEIEAFIRFEEEQQNQKHDEYGEEGDDKKDQEQKEKPVMPEFNKNEYLTKWLEENPEIVIPPVVIEEKDNDWYMNQEEEDMLIAQYYAMKGEPQP